MLIRSHYFKPESKTGNSDFTIFGMKIGPVPDLQDLPLNMRIPKLKLKIVKIFHC